MANALPLTPIIFFQDDVLDDLNIGANKSQIKLIVFHFLVRGKLFKIQCFNMILVKRSCVNFKFVYHTYKYALCLNNTTNL